MPAQARGPFVAGFKDAAKGGIEVGAGQNGAAHSTCRAGIPKEVAAQIAKVAQEVFDHGYVTAMKPTMALPIVVVLVAAASCFVVRRSPAVPWSGPGARETCRSRPPPDGPGADGPGGRSPS